MNWMKWTVVLLGALVIAAVLWWLGPVDFAGADGGDPLLNWPTGGGEPMKPPVKLVGDSLRDVVTESEGGQMPSEGELNRRGASEDAEAEMHLRDQSVPQPPDAAETEADVTSPRVPDAEGPGRVSTPATWGFVAWGPRGQRIGGRLRDTRDECEALRAQHRQQHPDWIFSPCVWVRAERGTL